MSQVQIIDCTWQEFITGAGSFGQSALHIAARQQPLIHQ
jgi:hypothetical protein